MNLQQLRDVLRDNCFDDNKGLLPDGRADRLLNAALLHVCNWVDRQDQSLFVHGATAANVLPPSGSDVIREVPFYGGSAASGSFALDPTLRRVKRVLRVERVGHGDALRHELQAVRQEDALKYMPAATTGGPAYFVFNDALALVNPDGPISVFMACVYTVPAMVLATDTPGQSSGGGTANALPIEYHPLVALYATVLASLGDASVASAAAWREVYAEQRDALAATLTARRGARLGTP